MTPYSLSTPAAGLPDAELARAAQRGEKKAFVEIVARHQAMVCGIAFGILTDFAASEDAAQDAFLTAWRKIHHLREPELLRAWLGQIARTAALGYRRRLHGEVVTDNFAEEADPAPQPDEAAADGDEAALVRDSLTKLPEQFRVPLVLFYREGQSVRSVAEALDLSEDAVKQRLARGREMLRERVTGMIESVLTRTRPTAVFTMLIAAAIGALTAPAVIAGSVFTAAAAASASAASAASASTAAGGATSSATTVATAMSTSKSTLTIAAAIAAACLPLGYGARMGMETRPPDSVRRPDAQSAVAAAKAPAKPDFKNSTLYAEWKKLHDEHGSTAADMPALFQAIADIKDPVRRRIFRAAQSAEWAELSPEGGFAFFMEKGRDSGQREQFFSEWMRRDPTAAVAALSGGGEGWAGLARKNLTEIARRVPGSLAALAAKMPKSDNHWANEVRDAFAILAESGLEAARAAAEGVIGPQREQALAGIAKAWARTDPDAAIAWAKALPEGVDLHNIIRAALLGVAATAPASALGRVKDVPPGGREGYFADTTGARVLQEAGKTNYDATVAWLAAHPESFSREDLLGMADAVTQRLNDDPAAFLARHMADGSLSALMPAIGSALMNQSGYQRPAIWDWLKTQPSDPALDQLRSEIINSAGYQNPDFALQIARDLPDTPEGKKFSDSLARSLMSASQMPHNLDSLMAQAPDTLKPALVEAALMGLNQKNFADPQKWLALLPQLREEIRENMTARVARAWTEQAPEEAVAWATALPPGAERTAAIGYVTNAWAVGDSWRASEWVDTLPAGAERDKAAEWLVQAIAQESPDEAWDWAQNIGDETQRNSAMLNTLLSMRRRDPSAIADTLAGARITPQERAALLEKLDQMPVEATPPPATEATPIR